MRAFLVICCFVSILLSVGTCTVAKGAVHEIQGGIWLLIGVIFFVGATLLEELQRIRKGVAPDPPRNREPLTKSIMAGTKPAAD